MVAIQQLRAHSSNHGAARSTSKIKYIVLHYTANDGDKAINNAKYFQGANRRASAHYFVDDKTIYQSVPDTVVAWSVGDKKYPDCAKTGGGTFYGIVNNTNSISIEMCDPVKGGGVSLQPAVRKNAIDLTRMLMAKYNVPISRVIRHFDISGKNCPGYWATKDNADWLKFKQEVSGAAVTTSTPVKTTTTTATKVTASSSKTQFIKDIQKAIGVKQDGIVGPKTLAALPTISKTKNNKHAAVKFVQNYLYLLGYTEVGTADGIAGNAFDKAVRRFQKEKVGLKNPDGELTTGGNTWKKLLL